MNLVFKLPINIVIKVCIFLPFMDNKKLKIQVINFSKPLTEEWDQFVLSSNNGTIFHLRKFLSYHIERKFNDNSLLFILKLSE